MLICGSSGYYFHKPSVRNALLIPSDIFEIFIYLNILIKSQNGVVTKLFLLLKNIFILVNQYAYQVETYERKGALE
jgi:hypothetical protein